MASIIKSSKITRVPLNDDWNQRENNRRVCACSQSTTSVVGWCSKQSKEELRSTKIVFKMQSYFNTKIIFHCIALSPLKLKLFPWNGFIKFKNRRLLCIFFNCGSFHYKHCLKLPVKRCILCNVATKLKKKTAWIATFPRTN